MKFSRLKALVYRDYLIFIKSRWRWLELFYFPITSIIIWGLFAIWTGEFASEAGKIVLVINVFWSYAYVVQSTINLSINEDAWHSEAHHIFITGVGKWEYLLGRIIFSLLISSLNLFFMLLVTNLFFFNLAQISLELIPFIVLTVFLSVTLAILIAGLYFILGRDYAWLAWASLQFFILLSFPLSPLKILPYQAQVLARIMPYGNLFESLRNLLLSKPYFQEMVFSVVVGLIYFFISILTYKFGFDYSRKTGKFAKMF
ncbi:MAG: hypothetical protein QXX07_00780 [Candidatus Aenigmatarchaeota archaeon]